MKKAIIVALLILSNATPSHAANIVDRLLYKQVVLRNNNGTIVSVNRLTGKVEYVLNNGQRFSLTDELKKQFQMVYDAQESPQTK